MSNLKTCWGNTVCKKLFLIMLLILFILPCISYSQVSYSTGHKWQWLHPKPHGNMINWCKMWDANNWYMTGSFGSFYRTTDAGENWYINYDIGKIGVNDVSIGLTLFSAHFFDRNNGIVLGQYSKVYKTSNAGTAFELIPELQIDLEPWLNVYFVSDTKGYIIGQNKMAKTTNSGLNWTLISTLPNFTYNDIWTNDSLFILCSSDGLIRRSTDGAATWTTINTTAPPYTPLQKLYFLNKDTGFVCGKSGIVNLTVDGGLNWVNINNGLPAASNYYDLDMRISGQDKFVYLTGDWNYIYKTSNLGQTWDTVGFNEPGQNYYGDYQRYYSTSLGGGDTLLTSGVYGFLNKRNSISDRKSYTTFAKFGASTLLDVEVVGNNIWAAGIASSAWSVGGPTNDQIIYSSDGGKTWVNQNSPTTRKLVNVYMLNSLTGYIVGENGTVLHTNNAGNDWNSETVPVSANLYDIDFINTNTGWIFGASATSLKTTNSGINWELQTVANTPFIYAADMIDENTGWVCGAFGRISKTTDGGFNWSQQTLNTAFIGDLYDIKMVDANTGYIVGFKTANKTTNGGITWDSLALPLSSNYNHSFQSVEFINPEVGMIVSEYSSLRTTNGGLSWIVDYIGGLGGVDFLSMPRKMKMVDEKTAYVVTATSGVLKYTESVIGITEWQNSVPKNYELYQNYPNPFNPTTTIKFAIPKAGAVTLKVFDITGREVAVLINNMELNAGTVKHTFDGNGLASGVYFYSLFVDEKLQQTKKMILVK